MRSFWKQHRADILFDTAVFWIWLGTVYFLFNIGCQ